MKWEDKAKVHQMAFLCVYLIVAPCLTYSLIGNESIYMLLHSLLVKFDFLVLLVYTVVVSLLLGQTADVTQALQRILKCH